MEKADSKIIREREDLGLLGKVKSTLEYEYINDETSIETIKLKDSKYELISVSSTLDEIRDVNIMESNSHLFSESGELIKDIRFVQHDDIYMEDIESYKYNRQDKLIEWNNSDFDLKLDRQKLYKYDHNNRLVEIIEKDLTDLFNSKIQITYNRNTIQIASVSTRRGDTINAEINNYTKNGILIEDNQYVKNHFDLKENLIKVSYLGIKGKYAPHTVSYEYDYRNNKVKETEYDSINNVKEIKMFYYNQSDEIVKEVKMNSSGMIFQRFNKLNYAIDYNSFRINEELPVNDIWSTWENYDKYGNIIKSSRISSDSIGRLIETTYRTELEYDEIGNWTLKRNYVKDSLTTLIDRKIEYY